MGQSAYRPRQNRRARDPNQLANPPLVSAVRAVADGGYGNTFLVVYTGCDCTVSQVPDWTTEAHIPLSIDQLDVRTFKVEMDGDITGDVEFTAGNVGQSSGDPDVITIGPNVQWFTTTLFIEH